MPLLFTNTNRPTFTGCMYWLCASYLQ